MRGKLPIFLGTGLVLTAGAACSLLTNLDAPTAGPSPDAAAPTADAGIDAAEDATMDARTPAEAAAPEASLPDGCSPDASGPLYAATYVTESWPLTTNGALTMKEGQVVPSFITLTNTGTTTWDSNTMLGTSVPLNRASVFADSTWVSPKRAAAVKGTVPPGMQYTFEFDFAAPNKTGTYYEYFDLVDQGDWHCTRPEIWFGDPDQGGPAYDDIEVEIVVTKADGGT